MQVALRNSLSKKGNKEKKTLKAIKKKFRFIVFEFKLSLH